MHFNGMWKKYYRVLVKYNVGQPHVIPSRSHASDLECIKSNALFWDSFLFFGRLPFDFLGFHPK